MLKYLFKLNIQLFADDKTKVPTIEELQTQLEDLKKTKDEEIVTLKAQLDEEKRKNAQYVLASMGAKPQEEKPEEKIEFDFNY